MNEERTKCNRVLRYSGAAAVCFVGSGLSIAGGFVFTTGWLLNEQLHPLLHAIGIVLLIVGIPILILGGHFMDLLERTVRKADQALHVQGDVGRGPLRVVVRLVALCSTLTTRSTSQIS